MTNRGILEKNETGWSVKYEANDWTARWLIGNAIHVLPVLTESGQQLTEGTWVLFTITEQGFAKIIGEQ